MTHSRHGVVERLKDVFSGCTIKNWEPVPRKATGKVAEALDYVVRELETNLDGLVRFVKVRDAIGGMDASNFRRLRLHGDFVAEIAAQGIEVDRPGSYATAFRYACEEPSGERTFEDYFPAEDDESDQTAKPD